MSDARSVYTASAERSVRFAATASGLVFMAGVIVPWDSRPEWVLRLHAIARGRRSGRAIPRLPGRSGFQRSNLRSSTGFRSRIGVRLIASRSRTRILVPCMKRICTRWRPIGFGRSAERVLKTPFNGVSGLSLGCTANTSRRARSSQVSTRISAPTSRSCSPSLKRWSRVSHASGEPSFPCFGAASGSSSGDSTQPIGHSS